MLVSKIKEIRNGRVITKDATPTKQELDDRIQSLIQAIDNAHKSGDQNAYFENQKSLEKVKEQRKQLYGDSKTRDRNLVDINQERRRLEDKYEQALRDGDKGLAKSYSDRLEELRKEAIEAENKRDEERKNFGDSKTKDLNLLPEEIVRIVMKKAGVTKSVVERAVSKLLESGEVSAGLSEAAILKKAQPFLPINDSKTKDKKMRDGQSYNMAVEYELFTYYNIPRNQARQIVERNSQELQKKEDAGVSARNAADMLIHKEGIKGFEKIYVRPNDSKTKDSETAESLLRQFKARRLLDDRREYDVEDFMSTYDLPRAEAQKLFDMVQKATRDSKTKDMVDSNVISDTLDDIKAGKDPNRAFAAALEDNNFYGPKSKQDRVDMANALRSKGINVNLATVEKMLGISDSKDAIDPTKPKTIAAAKSLSVAQGKAATGDSKPIKRHLVRAKDEDKVGDWKNRVLGTMKKIYELQGEEDLYTLCNKAISQIRVPEVFRNEIYTDITGHWNASKNFILGR